MKSFLSLVLVAVMSSSSFAILVAARTGSGFHDQWDGMGQAHADADGWGNTCHTAKTACSASSLACGQAKMDCLEQTNACAASLINSKFDTGGGPAAKTTFNLVLASIVSDYDCAEGAYWAALDAFDSEILAMVDTDTADQAVLGTNQAAADTLDGICCSYSAIGSFMSSTKAELDVAKANFDSAADDAHQLWLEIELW